MAKDITPKDLQPGDIITVKLMVKEINAGESGANVRAETYEGGDAQHHNSFWLNSGQARKV